MRSSTALYELSTLTARSSIALYELSTLTVRSKCLCTILHCPVLLYTVLLDTLYCTTPYYTLLPQGCLFQLWWHLPPFLPQRWLPQLSQHRLPCLVYVLVCGDSVCV